MQHVLQRIETAQMPHIKELPHFGEFVKNVNRIPKILRHNAVESLLDPASKKEDINIETEHAKEDFTLHDVRGGATLFAGMQRIRGTGQVWDEYVRLVDNISGHNNAGKSFTDHIRSYEEIAQFIRKHDGELKLDHLGEEHATAFASTREAISRTAHVWPIIHYSSLMVDAAVNKKNYDQVDQWYRELINHPMQIKDITDVAVRRTCSNLDDPALQKLHSRRSISATMA